MLGEALALGCALAWGVSVVLFRRSGEVSPVAMTLFKNAVGCVLLGLTAAVAGVAVPARRDAASWLRLAASGVLGLAVADVLFFHALRRLGAGLVAVVDCAYAPLAVLAAVLVLDEPLGARFLAGAVLVVGGLAVATVRREAAPGGGAARATGVLMAVGSLTCVALAMVLIKPVLLTGSLVEVTLTRLAVGWLALAAWAAVRPGRRAVLAIFRPQRLWRRLLPAAVLGVYVSLLLWLGGIKHTSVARASVLNQLSVVFTAVLARVLLNEPLTARRAAGGLMAVAGATVILLGRS